MCWVGGLSWAVWLTAACVVSVTRCRPAPPSVRCTLWPRRSTRTGRREASLWTESSNMKTPTWPPPPCNTHTHTGVSTGVCCCSHMTTPLCCVFQCEGRHQQGGPGDPGVLQSQSQAGGVAWRVRHTHTLLTSLPVLSEVSSWSQSSYMYFSNQVSYYNTPEC